MIGTLLHILGTILPILGALGMFLFGMKVMSEALQKLSGSRLRNMVRTMTGNRFVGTGTGFLVTCLVQSSSATTVMIVSFVNAGLLTLVESIGPILGANLGTTTTFWLVSYFGFMGKFSVSSIALPIIGIGFPLIFLKRPRVRDTGEFLIGFGLLFLGLLMLKDAVPDIRDNPDVLAFIQRFTGHGVLSVLFFFMFGTMLTVIVQSSSVAGAITITMAAKGWIDFSTAAAIILGENVGTTITANLAALTANITAKRAALAHFFFNIIGVIWAITLFGPFVGLIDWLMPGAATEPANIPIHMAAFHSGFNFINICLVIGFVPLLARLVERVLPDRRTKSRDHLTFSSSVLPQTGEMNIAEAEQDIQAMGKLTRRIFEGFIDLLNNPGPDAAERAAALAKLEEESDRKAFEITDYLLKCSAGGVSQDTLGKVSSLLRVVAELEDICDCGNRLVMLAERRSRKNRQIAPDAMAEVQGFATLLFRFMDFCSGFISNPVTTPDMETAFQLEFQIDQSRKRLRKESMRRMQTSGDAIKSEMLYIDVLNNMQAIGNHSLNILQALRHQAT